ncbi:MAG TPA: hypothetical protein VF821_09440, partial [Lentzea sp.]
GSATPPRRRDEVTREGWTIDGDHLAPGEVVATLRARIEAGHLETWLTSTAGRSFAFVTNTERAMLMLLNGEGGFVLSHGQRDEYPDADTVPLAEALRIADHIVGEGRRPADAHHVSDR